MVKGVFTNYRRGKHSQRNRQILIRIRDTNSGNEAAGFIGRKVVWTSPAGRRLTGKIVGVHGRMGVLKARFERGLPGRAVGEELNVL